MAALSSASRDDFTEDILLNSTVFAAQKLKITGFKDLQLVSVLRGQDTFVSLPTGYSKSAIFQAIPLCIQPHACGWCIHVPMDWIQPHACILVVHGAKPG